jgi:hypothetical protein
VTIWEGGLNAHNDIMKLCKLCLICAMSLLCEGFFLDTWSHNIKKIYLLKKIFKFKKFLGWKTQMSTNHAKKKPKEMMKKQTPQTPLPAPLPGAMQAPCRTCLLPYTPPAVHAPQAMCALR